MLHEECFEMFLISMVEFFVFSHDCFVWLVKTYDIDFLQIQTLYREKSW